jgi:hypothetical protein
MSIFLEPTDLAKLTGIKRGRDGKTRDELQAEELRHMGIPFRVNRAGRVIVAIAAVEGSKEKIQKTPPTTWQSNILKHHN